MKRDLQAGLIRGTIGASIDRQVRRALVKGYILEASLQEEEDGRWSAWIGALPGCTAWGYSREEALEALRDAAELYIQDMVEEGGAFPSEGVQVVESPVVAVNL
jgi:predicted RNase H-like HicB family nuclease